MAEPSYFEIETSRNQSSYTWFSLFILASLYLILLISFRGSLSSVAVYLISVNMTALFLMWFGRHTENNKATPVRPSLHYLFTAFFGFGGSILGTYLFKHNTAVPDFRKNIVMISVWVCIGVVLLYFAEESLLELFNQWITG